MSLLFFAGGECLTRHGVLVQRTAVGEDASSFETFTRSGTIGYYIDSDGKLRNSDANVPRVEWISGTPYLLLEEARTNLCLQSEDIATSWANTRSSESTDTVAAPDGATTADTLIEDGTADSTHYIYQSVTKAASSLDYALSVYVKAKERSGVRLGMYDAGGTNGVSANFADITGTAGNVGTVGSGWTAGSSGIDRLGTTDWYRVWITGTSDTDTAVVSHIFLHNGTNSTYSGDGSSGLYVWGAQLEQAASPSSYIPTTTVAVARQKDTFYADFPHPPQAMTVYQEVVSWPNGQATTGLWFLGSATESTDPRMQLITNSNGTITAIYDDGTTQAATGAIAAPTAGQKVETLVTLTAAGVVDLAVSLDGAAQTDTTSGAGGSLPAAWAGERFYINSRGSATQGIGQYNAIKVASGVKTMAEMRAL